MGCFGFFSSGMPGYSSSVQRGLGTLLIVVLLAACGVGETPTETSRPDAEPPAAEQVVSHRQASTAGASVGRFSRDRAMAHVRRLAGDIGVRVRATRNETLGARYIADEFRSLGYDVNVQRFDVDGATSRNVIAAYPGARKYPFVIGGHMDSVPGAPGANDNASGTAVVLEIARLFAGTPQARWVRFMAFGAEEYGEDGSHHVGSQVYVQRLGQEGRNRLAGMLSVDMIADGRPLVIGHSGISEQVVARSVFRKVRDAGIATRWEISCDCSDNGPFEHAGIPASYMWSGDEPNYHDSSDTVANMKASDLVRTGRAVRAFVKELDKNLLAYYRRKG
jgi:hypothetical protein